MSTRMTRAMGVLATVVALGGVAVLTTDHLGAQGPGGRGGRSGGGPGGPGGPRGAGRGGPGSMAVLPPMMLERLDLTDAQRSQVRQIMESHRTDQQKLAGRAREAHQKLEAAISGTSFDENAVRTASADVAAVQADMAVARARVYWEVVQILTPEQQAKLKEMQTNMQQRQDRVRERGGERRGNRR